MNSNKFFLSASVAAIASIVVANPADALSVTYDFRTDGLLEFIDPAPATFTENGVTVGVSGNGVVGQSFSGLYVRTPGIPNDLPFQIDGIADEYLEFDFGDQLVQSISVGFRRVGSDIRFTRRIDENDDFGFFVDGVEVLGSVDVPGGNGFDIGTGDFFFDAAVPLGNVLRFTTPGFGDDYTIASLTVDVVPTPAAVLPVLGGLFAAARRRKDEQTEEKG